MLRRCAPILVVAALLAAGCANRREVYQARYIPTSGDAVFASYERARWKGDKEVFELPANPPGLEEDHRARMECQQPGPQFKPQTMLGIDKGGPVPNSEVGLQPMVRMSDLAPGAGVGPDKPQTIFVQSMRAPNYPVPPEIAARDLAAWDGRPRSVGYFPNPAQPMAATGRDHPWEWCLPSETPKATVTPVRIPENLPGARLDPPPAAGAAAPAPAAAGAAAPAR